LITPLDWNSNRLNLHELSQPTMYPRALARFQKWSGVRCLRRDPRARFGAGAVFEPSIRVRDLDAMDQVADVFTPGIGDLHKRTMCPSGNEHTSEQRQSPNNWRRWISPEIRSLIAIFSLRNIPETIGAYDLPDRTLKSWSARDI
jgi:hypothetical protein